MPLREDEIEYKVDLKKELRKIKDPSDRERAAKLAGEEVLKRLKQYVARGESPVSGNGKFKKLSENYAEQKKQLVGNKKANLSLFGDMMGELDVDFDDESFTIFIDEPEQMAKAFNHNTGDTLPKRPFIPNDEAKRGKNFKKDIVDAYKNKIKQFAKNLPKPKPEDKPDQEYSGSIGSIDIEDFFD